MILTNTNYIPGKEIKEHYGLVSGSTVRARNIGVNILTGIKQIFGGELDSYTELLNQSRDQAVYRMRERAVKLGANAIINIRFATSEPAAGIAEIYAYGTAVRV